jgi:isopenicillin N synthase-like dioxygenase
VNHGVPEGVVANMMNVSKEFFNLPESERMKNYSDDPLKTTRLSTSFNLKTEKVSNWRDYLRLHCHPLEDYVHEWPSNPPSFRFQKLILIFYLNITNVSNNCLLVDYCCDFTPKKYYSYDIKFFFMESTYIVTI